MGYPFTLDQDSPLCEEDNYNYYDYYYTYTGCYITYKDAYNEDKQPVLTQKIKSQQNIGKVQELGDNRRDISKKSKLVNQGTESNSKKNKIYKKNKERRKNKKKQVS